MTSPSIHKCLQFRVFVRIILIVSSQDVLWLISCKPSYKPCKSIHTVHYHPEPEQLSPLCSNQGRWHARGKEQKHRACAGKPWNLTEMLFEFFKTKVGHLFVCHVPCSRPSGLKTLIESHRTKATPNRNSILCSLSGLNVWDSLCHFFQSKLSLNAYPTFHCFGYSVGGCVGVCWFRSESASLWY